MVSRGEIWWADFGEPMGSEPGYRRPALVASSDRFNRSRIATVILVPITSNLRIAEAPGNVELARESTGLKKRSVANVSQVMVVDRTRLVEHAGVLESTVMQHVGAGLRLALDL